MEPLYDKEPLPVEYEQDEILINELPSYNELIAPFKKLKISELREFCKDNFGDTCNQKKKQNIINEIRIRLLEKLVNQDFSSFNKLTDVQILPVRIKSAEAIGELTERLVGKVKEWPLCKPIILHNATSPLLSLDFLGNNSVLSIDLPSNTQFMVCFAVNAEHNKNIEEVIIREDFLKASVEEMVRLLKIPKPLRSKLFLAQEQKLDLELNNLKNHAVARILQKEDLMALPLKGFVVQCDEINVDLSENYVPISGSRVTITTGKLPKSVHYVLQFVSASTTLFLWKSKYPFESISSVTYEETIVRFFNCTQKCEVEAVKSIVSLMCPISMRRMSKPVRGTFCKHISCFDLEAACWLTSVNTNTNGREKDFKCPICNQMVLITDLVTCEYTQKMLALSTEDQVEIDNTSGEWTAVRATNEIDDEEEERLAKIIKLDRKAPPSSPLLTNNGITRATAILID